MSTAVRNMLAVAGALALSACASLGGHPRIDDIRVPAQYGLGDSDENAPTQGLRSAFTREPVQDAWWRQFGDARLDRLIERVLDVNTDLASAGLRLQRARLAAGLAKDPLWPDVEASISTGYNKTLSDNSSGQRTNGATTSVSYVLDLWGRLRAQRDVAAWEAEATAEDLQSTRVALIANTADLYWTLAFLNQRIQAGEESLARLERTLGLVRTQFNAGAVSRLELREAEQQLQSQIAAQSQLEQQRVETRNALSVLLDGAPWPKTDEPQTLADARSPEIHAGIPAELLSRRPDLRAAELRLRGALANVGITATSYYPTLSLTGSVAGSSSSLSDVLTNPIATLGAGLSLPFLRWNEMSLNVDLANTEYEIAANDFRKTLYTAFTEVDNALSARVELARQVDASQASLDAATEVERLYEVRYAAGATPLRTWLDAQETRRNAELSLAERRLEQLRNDLSLFQALGGSG